MASLRTRFQSAANNASHGYAPYSSPAWQNPAGALTDGGDPAKVPVFDSEVTTNLLVLTNTVDKVPSGASVDGYELHFKVQTDPTQGFLSQGNFSVAQLFRNGSLAGDNRVPAENYNVIAGPATVFTFGGATEKFGTSFSAGDVNAGDFGIAVSLNGGDASSVGVQVHDAEITIHYTE